MMNNTRANQSLSAFEEKAAPKRGALREFAAFYKPHLGMFLLDMFCALVIALVDILFPVVTRKVLYDYIPNQAMRTFLIVMGAMLAAFLIRTAAQWIVTYLGHLMGVHIEADMRTAIFAHMQKLGFSFYDKNRTGLLMSRVTTDLFDITELAHHGPEDLFISIVTLTGSFLVLWNIQKKLALVLMVAVPMIVLFVAMRRRNMMKVSRDVKRRTAGINAEIESSISGVRVAKAFGNEDEEIDKFTRCTDQYVSAKQGYYKVMAGFFSGTELMMNLMSLSVIFVGSYLIMKNQMDIATLVTFNMYVASVQSPIRKLTQFTEQFTQGMAGFQRFRAIMHEDPDIVDAPDAVALTHVDGDIRFNDVSFSYDEGKGDVLSHINLHIRPGEIYGFIGHNGAGKTTTLRCVVGILQFDAGEITIGDRSIRTDPIACKRELAYIPDNPDLYDYMTGIRYLNFIADIFDVSAEVRGQRIHDYAARFELTDDLAQPIASYSHGMKQKLAIISAWLHQPRLIIMDEPFVGLDPKAAHLLKGMMREFCDAGGAIFFSTHVLEVAEKLCDKVAIIRGGKLIRSGTMEEVKGDDSLEEVFLELEGESC